MATKRKQRTKNDLSRLSAWPHQVKKNRAEARVPGARTVSRNEPQPGRTLPRRPVAHELPALYHETYLRVFPQDPYRLFSFWEIAGDALATVKNSPPGDAPLLRLYETDGKTITDFAVEKGTHSQYVRVPEPGRRYRLEYGVESSGRFMPLCSSNEVAVPAARVHELRGKGKLRVRVDTEKLTDFSTRAMTVAAVPEGSVTDMTDTAAHVMGDTLTSSFTFSSD